MINGNRFPFFFNENKLDKIEMEKTKFATNEVLCTIFTNFMINISTCSDVHDKKKHTT